MSPKGAYKRVRERKRDEAAETRVTWATAQGCGNFQKLERAGKWVLPWCPQAEHTPDTHIRLLTSRTIREETCVVDALNCGDSLQQQ